ncbi:MAG: hypothetical protein H7320_11665 [Ferruginibacter sp.]|nr:hypothetical protein [Ferruginibacter sp.]
MLFKTSPILRSYATLGEVNFAEIQNTVKQTEDKHIIPVLGLTQYNLLNTAYNTATGETLADVKLAALLEQCRKVIAPYVCYYYTPKVDGSLSAGGFRRQETQTAKSAYQYQVTNFREANLQEAEAATENLIRFLEANKTDYTAWAESDEFKAYRSLFIKTALEFNTIFPSHTPCRNYYAMRSKMMDVEELGMRNFLGDALFTVLKDKDKAGTAFTEKENVLIVKIKKAIANITVAAAVPTLNVRISDGGITLTTVGARTTNDAIASRSAADANALNTLINACNASGKQWIESAAAYMRANATDFDTWPGNVITEIIIKNTAGTAVYGVF